MNDDKANAEAQALRAAIEAQIPSPGVVCVTAAEPTDATETVALSVARAFASSGHKTLMLDVSGAGIEAIDDDLAVLPELQNGAAVVDATRAASAPSSLVITRLASHACARLRADEVRDMVTALRGHYSAVVVNVGEAATGGSALFFAREVDAVVVSIRLGRAATRNDAILLERLSTIGANILGVVPVSGRAQRRTRRALAVIDHVAVPAAQPEARLAR